MPNESNNEVINYEDVITDNNTSGNQEVADPVNDLFDTHISLAEEDRDVKMDKEGEVVDPKPQKQSKDIDSAFAKLRREAEEYKKQIDGLDKWVEDNFGKSHDLHTWNDYKKATESQVKEMMEEEQRQREEEYREMGYDPDVIRNIIKNDPEFNRLLTENNSLKEQLASNKEDEQLYGDFMELRRVYPDLVKSPKDIPPEVYEKVVQGMSLVDAYTAVNKNIILKQTREAERQRTLNNINSKQHLNSLGETGEDAEDLYVPEYVIENYMNVGFSRKEAIENYKKYAKIGSKGR